MAFTAFTILLVMFFVSACVASIIISSKENFDFSNRNLTSVPRIKHACVTHLVLSHNLLTAIKYGDFNRMINLTYLDISNNRTGPTSRKEFKHFWQKLYTNIVTGARKSYPNISVVRPYRNIPV